MSQRVGGAVQPPVDRDPRRAPPGRGRLAQPRRELVGEVRGPGVRRAVCVPDDVGVAPHNAGGCGGLGPQQRQPEP